MNRRNGFTLIATGFCIASLLGMLGLALDLGRVYISKNETQSFTDTAALAAVLKLDGVSFTDARNAVTNNTKNQWNMGTTIFTATGGDTTITTEFARPQAANDFQPDDSTWSAVPPSAAGYTFVRVTATAKLPLYILPVTGTSNSQIVKTSSVAGQVPDYSFNKGLLPYSPVMHAGAVAANPPFGFVVGQWYTLRYPGGAKFTMGDLCQGDKGDQAFLDLVNLQTSDERGFYQDPSASIARQEIVDGYMVYPVTFPGFITMYGGAMNTTGDALNQRIDFDTDHTSRTYDAYESNRVNGEIVGNGFRLVGVPVNVGPSGTGGPRATAGFAGFFLSAGPNGVYYDSGGSQPFCAQYYGTWNKNSQSEGAGKPGLAYVSLLIR